VCCCCCCCQQPAAGYGRSWRGCALLCTSRHSPPPLPPAAPSSSSSSSPPPLFCPAVRGLRACVDTEITNNGLIKLDTRGKTQTRTTQEHLALDCRNRDEDLPTYLGNHSKLAQDRQEWRTFVAALCANKAQRH